MGYFVALKMTRGTHAMHTRTQSSSAAASDNSRVLEYRRQIFGQARYAGHDAIVEPEESLTKLSKATPWRRSTKEAELNAYVVIMLHGMVSHVRL